MGGGPSINYCCGGRIEKIEDDSMSPLTGQPISRIEPRAPVRKEPKSALRQRPPKDSALKKLGKSCCCGNLGDKKSRADDSQAPLPEVAPVASDDLDEGSPSMPKAVQFAGSSLKTALRHDLNGYWLLVAVEGDMDTFLSEFGRGWFYRLAASRLNFGIGIIAQHIKQEGDDVFIDRTLGSGSHVFQEFAAGGGQFETFDDLGVGVFDADFDNTGVLVLDGTLASGHPISVRRQRTSQQQLVDEITSCNGTTIRQVYELQSF
mmetsp:Transcript_38123/g.103263  ORF Transcript_38123/g.103263 Transcript_38123/m.103263 type:complete len:262 (-) Transcript_38123:145-930(-)